MFRQRIIFKIRIEQNRQERLIEMREKYDKEAKEKNFKFFTQSIGYFGKCMEIQTYHLVLEVRQPVHQSTSRADEYQMNRETN